MTNLIFFILATIGFTNIIVHGRILDLVNFFGKSIRGWMHNWNWSKQLFECYECSGFWSGLVCGYFLMSDCWYVVLSCGFIGSVVSQAYTDFTYFLNSKIEFEVKNETSEE